MRTSVAGLLGRPRTLKSMPDAGQRPLNCLPPLPAAAPVGMRLSPTQTNHTRAQVKPPRKRTSRRTHRTLSPRRIRANGRSTPACRDPAQSVARRPSVGNYFRRVRKVSPPAKQTVANAVFACHVRRQAQRTSARGLPVGPEQSASGSCCEFPVTTRYVRWFPVILW